MSSQYHLGAEKLLLLLVLATVLLLLGHERLLSLHKVIEHPADVVRAELDSDVQDGGNTRVEWVDKDQLHWRCEPGDAWPFPFCGLQLYLSEHFAAGVDLSRFRTMRMTLHYEGTARSLRVYLRNSNPAYTRPDEIRSTKFNMVELQVEQGPHFRDVDLEYFRVADWWLQLYPVDLEHSSTDFTGVALIEIQSGTHLPPGVHEFRLERFELIGTRLATETLYMIALVVWVLVILSYLALRIRFLGQAVQEGKAKQAELGQVNNLLDKRSRRLAEQVRKDSLTGAYNRAGMKTLLLRAFRNWRVMNLPMTLLMLDVDHFKRINDNHGHVMGDTVLRELSNLITSQIRTSDHFARWGGEEFIVVCETTTLEQAAILAEKLRSQAEDHRFPGGLKVTISIGLAQIGEDESLEELFKRADSALYRAKNGGRNQVRMDNPTEKDIPVGAEHA